MQQDVLQAQMERTKIVPEVTMHHQQMGQAQAHLTVCSIATRDLRTLSRKIWSKTR